MSQGTGGAVVRGSRGAGAGLERLQLQDARGTRLGLAAESTSVLTLFLLLGSHLSMLRAYS